MKKIIVVLILILLTTTVAAQDAGTTPDSIFYGLDRAMESIKLAFTRNSEKRANVHLAHAEERIAELQEMIQKEKTKYTEKLLQDREKSLTKAQEEIQKAKEKGKDVSELAAKVEEATSKHIAVLQSLLEKVPEQAKEHIQNAIEKSSRSKAVEAITKEKPKEKIEQPKLPKKPTEKATPTPTPKKEEKKPVTPTGTLVMQITDKKPELDITSLKVIISNIKVHAAGEGGTIEEVCTKENVTQEVCTNQTIPEIVPSCVNITRIVENCLNITINESVVLNCTNQTIIEETCTNTTVDKIEEICSNITETIETCSNVSETGENWFTVVEGPLTFDLIELQDIKELLGKKQLDVGKYTQIRLTISDAGLIIDDEEETLKIPSDRIKLVKNFNIVEGKTTTLTLDFDAKKSVHQAGSKYIMRPTIKVIQE